METTGIDQAVSLGASIAGRVTGSDGEALEGISVVAWSQYYADGYWSERSWATTGADGSYKLAGLPEGTYRLGFRDNSGMHAEEFFDDAATVQTADDIIVGASSAILGRDAQLASASHITGRVTSADGTPIADIGVQVYKKVPGQSYWGMTSTSVQTNADGRYDVGGLRAGTYRIGFSSYMGGYVNEYWDNAQTVETATDIEVGAATTVGARDAVLAAESHITGRVTGPDGAGLPNVGVQVYQPSPTGGWNPVQWASTDADGRYDARGLRAGTYRVGFAPMQGELVPEFWDNAFTVQSAQDIVVGESATVSDKDAQLATGAAVAGKVTGPGGAELANVSVQAYRFVPEMAYWAPVVSTSTNADGTYRLGGLASGTYRVGFGNYSGEYVTEYWDDASSVQQAQDIVLSGSELVTGTNAQLTRSSRITGTVTGADGGLAGISVQAYLKEPGQQWWRSVAMTQTNPDGTYSLGGLTAGTYRLGFSTMFGGGHIAEYWNDAPTIDVATDIAVGESDVVSGKDAQLAAASHITGKVVGPEGTGLSGISVSAYTKIGPGQWMPAGAGSSTTPDGSYDIGGLKAGTYRIGFSSWINGNHLAEFWDDAPTVELATDIAVGESATVSGKNAQLAAASKISGKVTGPDGAPLANVNVSAYAKAAGQDFWNMTGMSVQTRPDGTYELGGLRAGTYRIGFRDWQGGHLEEYWNDATTVTSANDIPVGESETVTGKDAELALGSHVTGKVTAPDGSAIAGVTVQAHQKDARSGLLEPGRDGRADGADGTYDVAGLKAGTYRLSFSSYQGGYVSEYWNDATTLESATDIVVGASETVTGKNAELALGSHITGKVTGQGGAGLGNVNVVAYRKGAGAEGGWSWARSTYTNPDGSYDLGGLTSGDYRLRFSPYHNGYVDEYWDDAGSLDAAEDIAVGASETVSGKDAQLASGAHITGTVTGPDGRAVGGVDVRAYVEVPGAEYWESVGLGTTTNPDGTYDLGGLRAGTYRIGFAGSGQGGFVAEYWDDARSIATAKDIIVDQSATVSGKNAQLASGAHITGTVTGADGTPLSDVEVGAFSWNAEEADWIGVKWTYTMADGSYDLKGLAGGTYRIGFFIYDGKHAIEYWNDAWSAETAADVVVVDGGTATGKDVQLARGSTIDGTVAAPGSVSDVRVTAYRQGSGGWREVRWAYPDEDGSYAFTGLAAGTYRVGFEDESGQWVGEFWNDRPSLATADDIVVGVGATASGKNASLAPAAVTAYENTVAPSISGVAQVGKELQAAPGSWSPVGASFAYQWLADGAVISGARRRRSR